MTKKYRLLIDSPEYPKGTIATQDPDGDYVVIFGEEGTGVRQYLNKKQIENRPEVWQLIEEPKQSFKKWRAEKEGEYWYIDTEGHLMSDRDTTHQFDNYRYLTGNYFQTGQEAITYKKLQEAIGRVTHAIIEANEGKSGNYAIVWRNGKYDTLLVDYEPHNTTVPLSMPPVLSEDIALSIISSHKEDLDLIFNLKK